MLLRRRQPMMVGCFTPKAVAAAATPPSFSMTRDTGDMASKVAHGYLTTQARNVAVGNASDFRLVQCLRMNIASRIKALRVLREEDQVEVAAAAGVSRVMVTQWEGRKKKPGTGSLAALAKHFGVTVDYLLRGEAPTNLTLTPDEERLMVLLRSSPEHVKATVRTLLENTAETAPFDPEKKN
jgi:transcriptional regulator with XRE-family HTH domain